MAKKPPRMAASKLDGIPTSPIDALLKRLDALAAELETRWGAGVLINLVTPETAAKWIRAKEGLDAAIQSQDYDAVKVRMENLMKGWQRLEQEAIESGHEQGKFKEQVWCVASPEANGIEYFVAKNELDAARFVAAFPSKANVTYTLAQIAKLLDAQSVVKLPAKELNAMFKKTEKPFSEALGDSIPF